MHDTEQWDIDPLYSTWNIPGHNVYNQSMAMPGQPSVFPSRVMYTGYWGNFHWSIPIIARMQQAITDYAGRQAYQAPPVPHSGSVSDMHQRAPRPSNQSDVIYANMRAPRF